MTKTFGQIIKELREKNLETITEVSKELKISEPFLCNIEQNNKTPPKYLAKFYIEKYNLKGKKKKEIEDALFFARNDKNINLKDFNSEDKHLLLKIARNFKKYKKQLLEIIK